MIEGLLAYSRVNSLGEPLQRVRLDKRIDAAILELRATLDANKAKVVVPSDLPDVIGDSRQLKELFFHLIDNAIKYRSQTNPLIDISCKQDGDLVAINVTDNGIGIDALDSDRIFTIFKRTGSKNDAPGAGVGLAICRRIVLRHHGRISIQSNPDGGSTVTLT
jgi:two-component system CheB/CheR fusion protein